MKCNFCNSDSLYKFKREIPTCQRHYLQLIRHGKVFECSRGDKSKITYSKEYAILHLYNRKGEKITQSKISFEDIELIQHIRWFYSSTDGYVKAKIKGKQENLHRYLLNAGKDEVVDHINRDKLDNRRVNLRICSQQENSFNHSLRSDNTSGHTGVVFCKQTNKWRAQLMVNQKPVHIGRFDTKEQAIEARKNAEIKYFGEFSPSKELMDK